MAQIFLKTSLKTEEQEKPIFYEGIGLFEEDKITYQEENVMTVIKKIGNQLSLVRKNREYEIAFLFDLLEETKGTYLFLDMNKKMDFRIITKEMSWGPRRVKLRYQLDIGETGKKDFEYDITYGVKK